MELREYKKGDEKEIFKLWHKIFGSLLDKNDMFDMSNKWWAWRTANPEGFPDIYVAALDSGEVVAHQMAEPFKLRMPQGKKTIYLSGNTMSDDRHRGLILLKLLSKCTKKILSEDKLGYGLPNESSQYIFEKFNWKHIGNIPILIRPLKLPFKIFDLKRKQKGYTLKKINKFDNEVTEFMNSTEFGFGYFLDRNHIYLNWRYADAPKEYEKRLLLKNNNVEGYAVFRNSILEGARVGLIMEIFAKKPLGFNCLLDEIINYFSKEKMSYISCFIIKNNFFYRLLKKRGFIRMPIPLLPKRNALVILDKQNEQKLLNIKNWYMSYGDWDCF